MERMHVQDEDGHKPEHEHEHDTIDDNNNSTNSNPEITNTTPIFPNFQNHPSFLSPPPHLLSPRQYPILPHPQYSEITPTFTVPTTTASSEDGGKIAKSRRTGRPPGAKNKPKPQIIITQQPEPKPAMSPYIIELPPGSDLVGSLTRFTRDHGISICVLSATGAVSDVTLKQPTGNGTYGTVTFRGNFDIFTLSACVMTDTTPFGVSNIGSGPTIAMAGPNGMIVGGKVVGPLVCAGTVYVVATSFNNPSYVRLPVEGKNQSDRVTGGNGGRSRLPVSEGGGTHVSWNGVGVSEFLCAPRPLAVRPPQVQPPY